MTAREDSSNSSNLRPAIRYIIRGGTSSWLYAALTPLCFSVNGLAADTGDQFNLPQLYSPQAEQEQVEDQGIIKDSEEVLELLDQQLKEYAHKYTRKQLTHDSAISLQSNGLRLETQYFYGDMSTEIEAEDNGDITFKLKISF
ncbi:hypothetical protein [Amphritea sp. HPY]|uniref:hypothetical protein n=1 Tax=Amphritea sp. HPY TaxID=3421652 RepID=UPI003D7D8034